MSQAASAAAASQPLGHAQAVVASIPFKTDADSASPSGQQWGLALVLCMALLVAAIVLLKRRGQAFRWQRRSLLVNVLENHPIGGQSQLVVASYAGRRLLICTGPGGASCLRDDPDEEVAGRAEGNVRS